MRTRSLKPCSPGYCPHYLALNVPTQDYSALGHIIDAPLDRCRSGPIVAFPLGAYRSRFCAVLSFSDPAFNARAAVPFLAQERNVAQVGSAGLLFWHGHVQRGSDLALRVPA